MLTLYNGHSDNIFALGWSPDGRTLASGSRDCTVQIWRPETGELLLLFQEHQNFVRSLSWSPDGRYQVSGGDFGDSTAQVWEALSAQPLCVHTSQYRLFSVAWSPIHDVIASASFDGSVQLWQALTDRILLTYRRHQGPVYVVSWSPDGVWLASAGEDGRVHIWSPQSAQPLVVYRGHTRAVKALSWSPDGRLLVTGGEDNQLHIWSATTGELSYLSPVQPSWIRALAWSPDGAWLAWACKKQIFLFGVPSSALQELTL